MDYFDPFKFFLCAVADDPRIGASHISLYGTLCLYWMHNQGAEPVYITREGVMKIAKISGTATYHKRMKELDAYGYIQYVPSHHPKRRTKIYLKVKNLVPIQG